ncbi:hypothetical protein GRF29_44g467875 [Pseudopithomyces chartarum]|uniref:Uncharacterized protein n=1 Tax=Pseudopithomyces chartarum TaxID=1892770 RepID=A0AAN6M259_9PLEO|nr:hypothetical protein GRF29_44g467875 [Pseudopithomyces chartarum]
MSRVRTPFSDTGEDAFLPSIEQDDGLYDTRRDLFEDQSTPIFSSTFDKDGLDDLDLASGDGTNAPQNSRTTSGTITPEQKNTLDFSGYDFEPTQQSASIYPSPDNLPEAMHLYPTHLQKPSTIYHKGDRRPLPHRSTTNTDIRLAPGPLQTFHQAHNHPSHRRSYSQNDTERILEYPIEHPHPGIHYPPYTHTHPHTTPTFVRLCETRNPRSTSKPRFYTRKKTHPQSTPNTRNRALPPMSVPVGIGIPLHPDPGTPVLTDGPVQLTGPRMTHMAHATQRASSQKIIELGAMAVYNKLVKEGGRRSILC